MTKLYSPNFSLLSNVKETIRIAFTQLRRVRFLVEESFEFGDFDPKTNFNGMVSTAYVIARARYLKIYKFLWFSVDITSTLAAPFTSVINITIPYTAAGSQYTEGQAGGALINNNSARESGYWVIHGNTNEIIFVRSGAAFSAGIDGFSANGFIEII